MHLAAERRLIRSLRNAGATSASRATRLDGLPRIRRRRLRRLEGAGVIRSTQPGLYWLDEAAYEAHRHRRRQIAVLVMAGFVLVVGIFLLAQQR